MRFSQPFKGGRYGRPKNKQPFYHKSGKPQREAEAKRQRDASVVNREKFRKNLKEACGKASHLSKDAKLHKKALKELQCKMKELSSIELLQAQMELFNEVSDALRVIEGNLGEVSKLTKSAFAEAGTKQRSFGRISAKTEKGRKLLETSLSDLKEVKVKILYLEEYDKPWFPPVYAAAW